MKRKLLLILVVTLSALNLTASLKDSQRHYSSGDKTKYFKVATELMEDKLYFTALPFIKDYLLATSRTNDAVFDSAIDELITEVGVKQFEVLPNTMLEKSGAPTIKYILARKEFRKARYESALRYLKNFIDDSHPVKPYALLLEGSIHSILKNEDQSIEFFKDCISVANKHIDKADDLDRKRQLIIARDYCLVGISRTQFAKTNFTDAYLSYLDLPKSSHIWPEILFEEAWNSFFLKDYNRTLGKLVTYKAPVLNYVFNPEIDVLRTLTFMELCLWDDTKKSVEDFYNKYETDYDQFKKFLNSLGKDYKLFYNLVSEKDRFISKSNSLLTHTVQNIARDPAFVELKLSLEKGKKEKELLEKLARNKQVSADWKSLLEENLKDSLSLQRDIIGSYIRGQFQLNSAQIYKAFEDMSYIKLEVLSKRKNEIYKDFNGAEGRSRGDIAYLKRNEKQYFWIFNGEFWADELGDYVFSLRSECR